MQHGLALTKQILPFVDVLFVNTQEAARLLEKKASIQRYCAFFHDQGISTVVITDGEKGSYASTTTSLLFLPSFRVPVIAKTGAGDAFASGFFFAYIRGASLEEALRSGTANASGVLQQVGATQGLLTPRTLRSMMQDFSSVRVKQLR